MYIMQKGGDGGRGGGEEGRKGGREEGREGHAGGDRKERTHSAY